MKFSELIDSCIECLKSFNPIVKTLDSHADDFLKAVSIDIQKATLTSSPLGGTCLTVTKTIII